MKTGNYLCKLCENEFEPTRRGVQKFCSSNCRKKYSYHKNKRDKKKVKKTKSKDVFFEKRKKTKVEEMSLHGIGNATAGVLIMQMLTKLLTKVENKSATKGDIQEIKEMIEQRYFQVHNVPPDSYQRVAYFDMGSCKIVYFDPHSNQFVEP